MARNNNIGVKGNISKPELIKILGERNLITTTPITAQESNLGVLVSKVPIELIRKAKKKAQSATEEAENFKEYITNLKSYNISANRLKKLTKQLERKEKKAEEERNRIFTPIREASAFKNYTNQYVMYNTIASYPVFKFLADAKPVITNIFNTNRNIKTALYLYVLMSKGERMVEFAFHYKDLKLILMETDENEIYDEMVEEIEEEMQKARDVEGSGWQYERVIKLVLHTTKWEPLYGSSYMPLDPYLANKKALINMQNEDDKCFMWSVLRALYPKDNHTERIDNDLKSKQNSINMKGIHYPVNLKAIDRSETQNPNISISVVGYNKEDLVHPIRISKYTGCDHDITLLLLKEAVKGENGKIKEKCINSITNKQP